MQIQIFCTSDKVFALKNGLNLDTLCLFIRELTVGRSQATKETRGKNDEELNATRPL